MTYVQNSVLEVELCNLKYEECITCMGVKKKEAFQLVVPLECLYETERKGSVYKSYTDKVSAKYGDEWLELAMLKVDSTLRLGYFEFTDSTSREFRDLDGSGLIIPDTVDKAMSVSKLMLWRSGIDGLDSRKFEVISRRDLKIDTVCSGQKAEEALWRFVDKDAYAQSSMTGSPLFTRSFNTDSIFFLGYYVGNYLQGRYTEAFRTVCKVPGEFCSSSLTHLSKLQLVVRKEDHFSRAMNSLYRAMTQNTRMGEYGKSVFRKSKFSLLDEMYSKGLRDYAVISNYDVSEGDHESVKRALASNGREVRTIASFSILLRRLYLGSPCEALTETEIKALASMNELTQERKRTYKEKFYERIGIDINEIRAIQRITTLHDEIRRFLDDSKDWIREGNDKEFQEKAKELLVEIDIYRSYYKQLAKGPGISVLMNSHAQRQLDFLDLVEDSLIEYQKRKKLYCTAIEDSLCAIITSSPCEFENITRSFKYNYDEIDCGICDSALINVSSWSYDFSNCETEYSFEIEESLQGRISRMIESDFKTLDNMGGVMSNVNATKDIVEIKFEISSQNRYLQTYAQLSDYPLAVYRNIYTIRFDSCLVNFLYNMQSDTTLNYSDAVIEFYGSADGVPYRGELKYDDAHYGDLDDVIPDRFAFLKDGRYGVIRRTSKLFMNNNQKLAFLRAYEHKYNLSSFLLESSNIRVEQTCEVFSAKDKTKRKSEVRITLNLATGQPRAQSIGGLMGSDQNNTEGGTDSSAYIEEEVYHTSVLSMLQSLNCAYDMLQLSKSLKACNK